MAFDPRSQEWPAVFKYQLDIILIQKWFQPFFFEPATDNQFVLVNLSRRHPPGAVERQQKGGSCRSALPEQAVPREGSPGGVGAPAAWS